ncbi:hypothetical protein A4X13_0g947 [Tilletia indica]|uniref:Uncharacterized protein n=1 Tax=Tilletia indica TaxID=43049 RepID=A0A177TLM1_9BASI|nr:hypothetical protein A4X13_0g947 [Tilletia indica]
MIQHAAVRKPTSGSIVPQPSQLWARRMGTKAETQRGETACFPTSFTPSFARVTSERSEALTIPTSTTAFDLRAAPTPPSLSPFFQTLPRSSTVGELKPLTPLSTKSPWSHTFLSDIWSPRESDNLISPISAGTPLYPDHRKSTPDSATIEGLRSFPSAKSLGHTPKSSMSAMDKDNMAVAVQVALQIIGQDGAYDSDDEQYCRQALRWLQDPSSNDEDNDVPSGHGRARSKTDAGEFMATAGTDGMDDDPPKRKGRARMSQEKRRRLARRKEREALMLLGLPPIPSSAPPHAPSFRLPPLITNTLASVASSNLSPEERASAVEAARVLVASTGFFNQHFRMPQRSATRTSSTDALERRKGSVPNLRSTQSTFASEPNCFPSSLENIDHAFARFHMGDPAGFNDYRPRTMTVSGASSRNRLSSSFGMPSMTRGGSAASSLASTPLHTPENFTAPLPPTSFSGGQIYSMEPKDMSIPFGKDAYGGMGPVKSFGNHSPYHFSNTPSSLQVPNVCVMPPTPHNKGLQHDVPSLKRPADDTQPGNGTTLARRESILNLGSDEIFPSLATAASRMSTKARVDSMASKAAYGAIGPPKPATDPISQNRPVATTLPASAAPCRRSSNISLQSTSSMSSSNGSTNDSHALYGGCYFPVMPSVNSGGGLCPADDAIARVEAKWREAHAQVGHDSQLAQTSRHLSIPLGGMQVPGLSSAADRPMGSLGSSSFFQPHRHLSLNNLGPSDDAWLGSTQSNSKLRTDFDFGFGMPRAASPTMFAHRDGQQLSMAMPTGPSALGLELDMGGPLDFGSA